MSLKTTTTNGITVSVGDTVRAWKYVASDDWEYSASGPVVAIVQDTDSGRYSALVRDGVTGRSRWFWVVNETGLTAVNQFEVVEK